MLMIIRDRIVFTKGWFEMDTFGSVDIDSEHQTMIVSTHTRGKQIKEVILTFYWPSPKHLCYATQQFIDSFIRQPITSPIIHFEGNQAFLAQFMQGCRDSGHQVWGYLVLENWAADQAKKEFMRRELILGTLWPGTMAAKKRQTGVF